MADGLLIALGGEQYSGKSTVSAFLSETGKWERIRFAGPFKSLIHQFLILCGYDPLLASQCIDGSISHTRLLDIGLTSKWMLEIIGDEFPLVCEYPKLWSYMALARSRSLRKQGRNVVIDDLAFDYESHDIHRDQGKTILIIGNHENKKRKDDIHILNEIYLHDGYISDDIFRKNFISAWDSTLGRMSINKINSNIKDTFIYFLDTILLPGRNQKHFSEKKNYKNIIKSYDYSINNQGSLSDLKDNIGILLMHLNQIV